MKVILDTNSFISGVFFSGAPFQILKAWQEAKIELAISPDILDEYQRVGKFLAEDHPGVDLMPMLEFVIQNAEFYSPTRLIESVCEDPDDDKFFACAVASGSKIIVSGDKHLLEASGYRGIEVLKPGDFLDKHIS